MTDIGVLASERLLKLLRFLSHKWLNTLLVPVVIDTSPHCQSDSSMRDSVFSGWRKGLEHAKDMLMKSIIKLIACAGLLALFGCATQSNQGGTSDDQSQTIYDSSSSYPPAQLGDGP
jgi:hypothetical protein